jgi:hypothetical protein
MSDEDTCACDFNERSFSPSPLSQLPCLIGGITALTSGFYFRVRGVWMDSSAIVLPLALMSGIVGIMLILVVLWRCRNERLCFCSLYVSRYTGILGNNLRTSRLLYHHIRGVEIEQSIMDRLLDLGDIHVSSDNSRAAAEIVIRGVRRPEIIKDVLLERVAASQTTTQSAA